MNNRKHTVFNKRFTLFLSIIVMLFCTILYSACKKTATDTCKDIHCINGGACNSGKCTCPSGFSGTYCETVDDPCSKVTCQHGGTCDKGKCTCPTGFSGTYCEIVDDPCLHVTCQHGGTCSDGICTCPIGYEGTNCETRSRDKFVGTYTGSEACTIGADNYTITITAQTDETKLTLTNLYNYTIPLIATCTLVATDSFTFSGSNGTIVYSGSGRLVATSLTLHYSITDGTTANSCMYTGFK